MTKFYDVSDMFVAAMCGLIIGVCLASLIFNQVIHGRRS